MHPHPRTRRRRVAALVGILCLAAARASAAEHDAAIDVDFPDRLGGLVLQGRQTFGQPELGASYGYQNDWGSLRVGIYVYTAGLKRIPDDLDAGVVRRHFDQVIGEVKSLQQAGKLRAFELTDAAPQRTELSGCGPQFVRQSFTMELGNGTVLNSATYLTVQRDNFIKLRVSYRSDAPEEATYAQRFIGDLRRALGHCATQAAAS